MKFSGRLVWVGRENKDDPERALCSRYFERITRYGRFDEVVVKPIPSQDIRSTKDRECRKILRAFQESDFVVLCDERGKQLSSPGLAEFVRDRGGQAGRRLVWVIGGSMGVADELRQRADFVLSLGKMTLPHGLARVVLFEQIYRALSILAGHPYHHES